MTILESVKQALGGIETSSRDGYLTELIEAAVDDLGLYGITEAQVTTMPLVRRAICTYAKLHSGYLSDGEYDRVERSYQEQKAQLGSATGYTDWGSGA